MSKIQFAFPSELPWLAAVGDYELDGGSENYGLTEVDEDQEPIAIRVHHPGADDQLQMYEVAVRGGHGFDSHAHDEDEIIFVLDGELVMGSRTLRPGDSVLIPGNQLYAFKAGGAGLRFLNFRAVRDLSFYTKDEFLARRDAARAE